MAEPRNFKVLHINARNLSHFLYVAFYEYAVRYCMFYRDNKLCRKIKHAFKVCVSECVSYSPYWPTGWLADDSVFVVIILK